MGSAEWLVWLGGAVIAVGACTRDNPAYDGDGPGESEGVSTGPAEGGPTTGVSVSDDAATTTSPDSDASATTLPDPDATTTPSTDTGEPTSSSESGNPVTCDEQSDDPLDMDVTYGHTLVDIPLDSVMCAGFVFEFTVGMLVNDGNAIEHHPCQTCDCETFEEPTNSIVAESFELPMVPECGRVLVWARNHPELGGCVWDGLMVLPPSGEAPLFVGANSRLIMLPLYPELGLELELDSLEDCPDPMRCNAETGIQAIGLGGQWVPHGEPGSLVLFDGIEYDVENRVSFIDPACQEHVSWTASRPL